MHAAELQQVAVFYPAPALFFLFSEGTLKLIREAHQRAGFSLRAERA
jgi:hypothetical protein